MGKDECTTHIEQDIHWGDCVCSPPCAVFTENTKYNIKENGSQSGSIEEESSFICRMCIPAGARTMKSKIKCDAGEFNTLKNFKLGYGCTCCCPLEHRPEVKVMKGESVIGHVIQPCCPQWLCQIALDLYKGEHIEAEKKMFQIKKCCCNCHMLFGKMCGCCVDMCDSLEFGVHDEKGPSVKLYKKYFGFINECCNMADKYLAKCPSDGNEKAIFLSAIHFIDLMFFENNYYCCGGI
jgi:hypothetical protein